MASLGVLALAGCSQAATSPSVNTNSVFLVKGVRSPQVLPFALQDVRLLDGPFKHAQQLDRQYLLSLDPDRLLHNFRVTAGLQPKAPLYGGWEEQGIAGHTLGHYLTAVAEMIASTGDAELQKKLDYTISELALCQQKLGTGYIGAIPGPNKVWGPLEAGKVDANGFGLNGGWVPWYTQHKIFAGLIDAYTINGNVQAKAVLLPFADWAINVTRNLDDAKWQQMLRCEHGGMNEAMANVYALTNDKKYLELAQKFSQRALLEPLSQKRDTLTGMHANTQIPKVIGFERLANLTGDGKYSDAAQFFWQTVTQNRSFAIGGNSDREHFFAPEETSKHLSMDTAENCNAYNMLKLTQSLYQYAPSPQWIDYYERTLFNQILSSQDPVKGGFNYLNSLKQGGFKVYSNPTTAFWCCVGSGMENHAKYGEAIYHRTSDSLIVDLFIPSTVQWRDKGVTLTQNTRFPDEDTTRFTVSVAKPTKFALKLRQPVWTSGAKLLINGNAQKVAGKPDSYETIERTWKNGDTISWQLPMALHSEALAHSPNQRAILYGPIVLAADLGRAGLDKYPDYVDVQTVYSGAPGVPVPSVVSNVDWSQSNKWSATLKRASGADLSFQTTDLMKDENGANVSVKLIPFSRAHHIRYNVYWDLYSPEEWTKQQNALKTKQETERALAARTLDEFHPNEQQSEVDHNVKSERSRAGDYQDRKWRDAFEGGFFEFDLKNAPDATSDLIVTYWGGDAGNRHFDILVNGEKIASQTLNNNRPGEFFDVIYPIPAAVTAGKAKVTVRFQANPGADAGGIFGARLVRHQ